MKRTIITYAIIFAIVFTSFPIFPINATSEVLIEEEVLLFEDFQTGNALNMPYFDDVAGTVQSGCDIEEHSDYTDNGIPRWTTRTQGKNNSFDSDVVNFVKRVNEGSSGNKAASFQMAKWANNSNAAYEVCKKLYRYENNTYTPVSITDGMAIIKLKVMPVAGAGTIHIALNSSKAAVNSDPNFRIICADSGTGPILTLSSEYGTIKSGIAASYTGWTTIEYRLDFDSDKGYIYVNDSWISDADISKIKFTGVSNPVDTVDFIAIGLNYKNGASAVGGGYLIDDISIKKLSKLNANMNVTSDGALNKAILKFNNKIDSDGVLPTNITVANGSAVSSVSQDTTDTSGRTYKVEFSSPLSPETTYNVTLNGIKDIYGFELTDKVVQYKTRDKRLDISPVKYYLNDYMSSAINVLSAGKITAQIDINNELGTPCVGDLILVRKNNDVIQDAKVEPVSIDGGDSGTVSASLDGVEAGDKLEVYLWDMWDNTGALKTLNALKPTEWITSSEKGTESGYIKSAATAINGTMSIAEDKTATIDGAVTPDAVAETAHIILKDGRTAADLTKTNFENDSTAQINFTTLVMCIGQGTSIGDGSYSTNLKMNGITEGRTYASINGSGGAYSVDNTQYFLQTTREKAVSAVNSADAETLAKYISGEQKPSGMSVYLNDVLKLDLSVYNTLKEPIRVCEELVRNCPYSDRTDIDSQFRTVVSDAQKREEDTQYWLNKLNNAVWSDIETILTTSYEEDAAQVMRTNHLDVDWAGNYEYIKNDETMKAVFYKYLANDYTFTDLKTLKDTFDSLALTVYYEVLAQINADTGSGSSGGGGGMVSFGGGKTEKPTPIVPNKTETGSAAPNFKDVDSVPWAAEAIVSLAELGVINGISADEFAPNDIITREQYVKMIVLAFGLYNASAENIDFIDVDKNHWSSQYIASAIAKEIINGIDSQHFGVGQELTRAEMATILNRVVDALGIELPIVNNDINYMDDDSVPDYARAGIEVMSKAGIMNGVGGDLFAPREKTTRAMAAKVIYLLRGMCK